MFSREDVSHTDRYTETPSWTGIQQCPLCIIHCQYNYHMSNSRKIYWVNGKALQLLQFMDCMYGIQAANLNKSIVTCSICNNFVHVIKVAMKLKRSWVKWLQAMAAGDWGDCKLGRNHGCRQWLQRSWGDCKLGRNHGCRQWLQGSWGDSFSLDKSCNQGNVFCSSLWMLGTLTIGQTLLKIFKLVPSWSI